MDVPAERRQRVDTITVDANYVCPFCSLWGELLAQYRETRETPLRVDWHPFDLRADRRGPDGTVDTGDVDSGNNKAYYARVAPPGGVRRRDGTGPRSRRRPA